MMRHALCFTLFLLSLASTATAAVDPGSGALLENWIDMSYEGKGMNLIIKRRYNHQQNNLNIFGQGWCSDIDTRVHLIKKGEIVVTRCGYKVFQGKSRKGSYFLSKSYPMHYVAPSKGQLYYWTGDRYYIFNKQGLLSAIQLPTGQSWKLVRKGEHIRKLSLDRQGVSITFKYLPGTQVVQALQGPNGVKVEYGYDRSFRLKSVKNAWKNLYKYSYDSQSRLTEIHYPDGTKDTVNYDRKNRVAKISSRWGCRETLTYQKRVPPSVSKICSSRDRTPASQELPPLSLPSAVKASNPSKFVQLSTPRGTLVIRLDQFRRVKIVQSSLGVFYFHYAGRSHQLTSIAQKGLGKVAFATASNAEVTSYRAVAKPASREKLLNNVALLATDMQAYWQL